MTDSNPKGIFMMTVSKCLEFNIRTHNLWTNTVSVSNPGYTTVTADFQCGLTMLNVTKHLTLEISPVFKVLDLMYTKLSLISLVVFNVLRGCDGSVSVNIYWIHVLLNCTNNLISNQHCCIR